MDLLLARGQIVAAEHRAYLLPAPLIDHPLEDVVPLEVFLDLVGGGPERYLA